MDIKKFKHCLIDKGIKNSNITNEGTISKSRYYKILKGQAIASIKEARFFKDFLKLTDDEFFIIFLNE